MAGAVRHGDHVVAERVGADLLLHVAHDIEYLECLAGLLREPAALQRRRRRYQGLAEQRLPCALVKRQVVCALGQEAGQLRDCLAVARRLLADVQVHEVEAEGLGKPDQVLELALGEVHVTVGRERVVYQAQVFQQFLLRGVADLLRGGIDVGVFQSFTDGHQVELQAVAQRSRMVLCGGHTEITDAVTRPVVIGSLAGTVTKDKLIDKKSMRPGDKVLLTKSVAVEGTAILAREFEKELREAGYNDEQLRECKSFIDHISIVEEAGIAARAGGVSAMHDVTEGGLAAAVSELSIVGRHQLRIDMATIPVYALTRQLCRTFDLSPLGLIGSGSLLICCRPEKADTLRMEINQAGIPVTCIGEVLAPGQGVSAWGVSGPAQWPHFEVDELARLFQHQRPPAAPVVADKSR